MSSLRCRKVFSLSTLACHRTSASHRGLPLARQSSRCFHIYSQLPSGSTLCTQGRYNVSGRTLASFGSIVSKRFTTPTVSEVRWSSAAAAISGLQSSSVDVASALPPGYIPAPPLPPVLTEQLGSVEIIQQFTALGEPTLQSLGLCSWWPSGFVQTALETVHVSLNVPWWAAIVLTTICIRVAVFPLVIFAQKNMANMHNHMPIVQKLQEKFTNSRVSGNPLEAARAGGEYMEYMKKNNVSPVKSMMVPLAQAPIFLSVFFGIKRMADLPVDSMTTGGLLWFTDLTITDPYYALPLLTAGTFLASLELGVDGVRAQSMTNTARYIMRAMPFIMLPFIMNFPSAMLIYWLTSNVVSFTQVLFLKIPGVKAFFGIPALVVHDPAIVAKNKKPFIKGIKDNFKNTKTSMSMEDRLRGEAVQFKQAGLGAIQKTYSYDPTKVQPKVLSASSKSK